MRPFYKRPEILSNWIISAPNLGTFYLIRRKGGVPFFLVVRTVVGGNILEVFLAVRTAVGEIVLEVFFRCPHGGRGEHFGRLTTPFATLDNAVLRR